MAAKKSLEIVYSRQSTGFEKKPGRAYANPRFFSTPRDGVSKVYLVGNWPNIEAAYKALGVPVEQLTQEDLGIQAPGPLPPTEVKVEPINPRLDIDIPDDWRTLPWIPKAHGELGLRALAVKLTDSEVLNKAQAVAAITAELARRGLPTGETHEPAAPEGEGEEP